jgi:predicted glycosyl hydrolase (DUF1957 family)
MILEGREMRVFVVTTGNYSDYGIDSIFSTREKAEAYVKKNSHVLDCVNIDEWEVDSNSKAVERKYWRGALYLKDQEIFGHQFLKGCIWISEDFEAYTADKRRSYSYWHNDSAILIISYVSKEHAHKLCAEAWQAYQAGKIYSGGTKANPFIIVEDDDGT